MKLRLLLAKKPKIVLKQCETCQFLTKSSTSSSGCSQWSVVFWSRWCTSNPRSAGITPRRSFSPSRFANVSLLTIWCFGRLTLMNSLLISAWIKYSGAIYSSISYLMKLLLWIFCNRTIEKSSSTFDLCALNYSFYYVFFIGSISYNICLCLDLIITLKNPLIPGSLNFFPIFILGLGKNRNLFYHIFTMLISLICLIV